MNGIVYDLRYRLATLIVISKKTPIIKLELKSYLKDYFEVKIELILSNKFLPGDQTEIRTHL